jgi:Cu(I)/Ag(I) efflux system membrane fusion protein
MRAKWVRWIIGIAMVTVVGVLLFFLRGPITAAFARNDTAGHEETDGTAEKKQERRVLYWVDAMNPTRRYNKPGKAPDGMDLVPIYADENSSAEMSPNTLKIDPRKLQMIGVQYGTVGYGPLTKTVRTVGRVTYDETKIARIHTKVEGWIDKVFVDFTGKLVEKDQPLISIYSPDLLSTQQEFLIARKAKDYLGNSQIPDVASNANSLYDAARERLRLWDINDAQIQELETRGTPMRALTLESPVSGFVLTRNAFDKQRVTPDTELYTIADLSTVWVLADVYEYEVPMIQLGETAVMKLSYFPGRTYTGKVSYIYPQLDNATRTLKVRIEFPNPGFELKPDMYADIVLQVNFGKQLYVPEEAVLDSGNEQIVFVSQQAGYFEPRRVELGGRVDGKEIVLSGLRAGERIVVSGNFLVDSESRLKSAMGAMAGMPGMEKSGGKTPAPEQKKAGEKANPPPTHRH